MPASPRPELAASPRETAAALSVTDAERAVLTIAGTHPEVLAPVQAVDMVMTARARGVPVESLLRDAVPMPTLLRIIASELRLPFVDMTDPTSDLDEDKALLEEFDMSLLAGAVALPLRSSDGSVVVVMANPRAQADVLLYLREKLPGGFTTAIGMSSQILARLLASGASTLKAAENLRAAAASGEDAGVVDWVETMFARAHAERTSDVNLKYDQKPNSEDLELVLRWRIDGSWVPQDMPKEMRGKEREIIGALLARCDTTSPSDLRSPQDGAFSFEVLGGRRVDARLGMVPMYYGPSITVRLLDPMNVLRPLEEMGFAPKPLEAMRKAAAMPQGMVFVIGPTGSGKSTTLYGMLNEVDKVSRNVLTVEDPVEYRMRGLGQVQVRSGLGADKSLTFAKVLRSFMRMAPDVILVGEVRDEETASTAVHAALTGHLLMSTIHANSALGVFTRLEEMGIEPYLASEAMSLAVSQRLLRKLHTCKRTRPPTPGEVAFAERNRLIVPEIVAEPVGCQGCRRTGYSGRLPVVEILEPSDAVREAVAMRRPASEVRAAAASGPGWLRILDDAHEHVLSGDVPVSELGRVLEG